MLIINTFYYWFKQTSKRNKTTQVDDTPPKGRKRKFKRADDRVQEGNRKTEQSNSAAEN